MPKSKKKERGRPMKGENLYPPRIERGSGRDNESDVLATRRSRLGISEVRAGVSLCVLRA